MPLNWVVFFGAQMLLIFSGVLLYSFFIELKLGSLDLDYVKSEDSWWW